MQLETNNFRFEDKKHAYFLNDKPLMGVTSVLGVISKPALIQWAANMAANYLHENGEKQELGWYRVSAGMIEEARTAHTRKKEKAADSGTDVHGEIEEYIKSCLVHDAGVAIPKAWGTTKGVENFIAWAVKNKIKFIASEKRMYSEGWWVAGTCDLVFEQDGKVFLGDIKTQKKMWDRVPFIQMAAYSKMYEETTGQKVDGTCVVLIPRENPVVETFYCYAHDQDIKAFEAALTLYKSVQL